MGAATMSRPEHQAPPQEFYNADESRKYTDNSRVQSIQAEMTYRCLELLDLPQMEDEDDDDDEPTTVPSLLLDIGAGSGLSGEILTDEGHHWVGCDISGDMLERAIEREVEGDLLLADIGQGFAFRPGSFDGAISGCATPTPPLARHLSACSPSSRLCTPHCAAAHAPSSSSIPSQMHRRRSSWALRTAPALVEASSLTTPTRPRRKSSTSSSPPVSLMPLRLDNCQPLSAQKTRLVAAGTRSRTRTDGQKSRSGSRASARPMASSRMPLGSRRRRICTAAEARKACRETQSTRLANASLASDLLFSPHDTSSFCAQYHF